MYLSRFGLATILSVTVVSLALADEPKKLPTTVVPVDRLSQAFWKARHEKFVEIAKKGDVDVLFLGDSITQAWESPGKAMWEKHFAPLKAANFGISGDRTEHVLWRITKGQELEGITPKVAVIMIGTNNSSSNSADEIAQGITAIVKELQKQKPGIKILLLAVFPRSDKPGNQLKGVNSVPAKELKPIIKEVNERIAKLDDGKNVVYLDIGPKFLESDGSLSRQVMPDFLHLSPKAYETWAEAIAPKITELLKK